MARLWQFLTDSRVLGVIGLAALAAFLFLGASALQVAAVWAGVAVAGLAALGGIVWLVRHRARVRAASGLLAAILPGAKQGGAAHEEVGILRSGMLEAVNTIKTSKLGLVSGNAALYELPWYMVIGNPAAGKSSAIVRSGLQFPIPGSRAVQGVGGTRNCDWFFTTDGILLDTAGRYSVVDNDRAEWFGFLELLRRHRPRAPINGILIAVSIAELSGGDAAASIELAKSLRTRVQELTERLGVHPPVYVLFTKVDLIAGFRDFFHDTDRNERDRAWGATIRYNRRSTHQDVVAFFDQHFDELHDGLKEMSLASMATNRSAPMLPGVFTFPLEFAAIKMPLRAFLATLFEENTWQFRPVFRGFYFTSALQEGAAKDLSSRRVASRFDLDLQERAGADGGEQSGYFLLELFRKVIFADKDLVASYTAPGANRTKLGAFAAAGVLFACALGSWTWSYVGNRQLIATVQADLDKVVAVQTKRIDLQSRLEALDILHERMVQLEQHRKDRPLGLSFGLYQGEALERKLREEYFAGASQVMLQPVASSIEALLAEVNANPAQLARGAAAPPPVQPGPADQPGQAQQAAAGGPNVIAIPAATAPVAGASAATTPAAVSATTYDDAYNALKAYLMLADKTKAEAGHLHEQMNRHWRGWLDAHRGNMPREQMIRSAERLVGFYVAHIDDPAWPRLATKLGLLDSAREHLRRVQSGTPARDRVYADIKARASARFPTVTVARIVGEQDGALIGGSHAVPGAFTRDAWESFVLAAFRDVSNKELQSKDWVLGTESRADLTLLGSPEQIQKSLIAMYKSEYVTEWLKFVQGVSIVELQGFDASVRAMNRLGDQQTSPIAKLIDAIDRETAWDNPTVARTSMDKVEQGMFAWFKQAVLRRAPSEARPIADGMLTDANGVAQIGPIGREFSAVARLVGKRNNEASLLGGYLDSLARLRTRLNQLKNQGDPGPGAKQFMQQTLDGNGSELADALKYVDEQMMTGMTDAQKNALRPLLVRPLLQTFAMIVQPSEAEINKTWHVQVVEPFRRTLADKYPFAPQSTIEASSAEVSQLFGPDGQIAKFVTTSMGPLVVRRGDAIEPRTWSSMGMHLAGPAAAAFPCWIAPVNQTGHGGGSGGSQQVFQLQAAPAPGILEYTIDIDGQVLRYRNTPPAWTSMVHPGPSNTPGARIVATTFDGRTVEVFNSPGQAGLKRLMSAASRTRKGAGMFELKWTSGEVAVTVDFRFVSSADVNGQGEASRQGCQLRGLSLPTTIVGVGRGAPPTELAMARQGGAQ